MSADEARIPERSAQDHGPDIVRLLQAALSPVEPPATLVDGLEERLTSLSAAAIETLEGLADWEMDAIRDPRNWVRPAAALTVGTAAGAALVLIQLHRARRARPAGLRAFAEQGSKAFSGAAAATRARLR